MSISKKISRPANTKTLGRDWHCFGIKSSSESSCTTIVGTFGQTGNAMSFLSKGLSLTKQFWPFLATTLSSWALLDVARITPQGRPTVSEPSLSLSPAFLPSWSLCRALGPFIQNDRAPAAERGSLGMLKTGFSASCHDFSTLFLYRLTWPAGLTRITRSTGQPEPLSRWSLPGHPSLGQFDPSGLRLFFLLHSFHPALHRCSHILQTGTPSFRLDVEKRVFF